MLCIILSTEIFVCYKNSSKPMGNIFCNSGNGNSTYKSECCVLRLKEIFVTYDALRVVLELNTSVYTGPISTIRDDLRLAYEKRNEFTALTGLKQIHHLLNTLESRFGNLYQLLPRVDSRRGLLDLGGNILR